MDEFESWIRHYCTQMNFGQVALRDGNLRIVQLNAVLRHLARKHDLYGEGLEEAAMIDMMNDALENLRKKCTHMMESNNEDGKQSYIKMNLPQHLHTFEELLKKQSDAGNIGLCVGKKTSFVDYNMFDFLDINLVLSPSCLDDFPTLRSFHKKMLARPAIKAHRQTEAFKERHVKSNDKLCILS